MGYYNLPTKTITFKDKVKKTIRIITYYVDSLFRIVGWFTQDTYFNYKKYDPNTQSVPDESFNNGDARDVQDGRYYKGDGVGSVVLTSRDLTSDYNSNPTEITIGTWFKVPNSPSHSSSLADFIGNGTSGVILRIQSDGRLRLNIGTGIGGKAYILDVNYNDNTWHSFIAVVKETTADFYIDSNLFTGSVGIFGSGNTDIQLGGFRILGGSGASLDGCVFAPFLYKGQFTQQQVSDYHNFTIDFSTLIEIWKCDEGGGTDSFASISGTVGTINNANLSTFHASGDDAPYSFQNNVGYTYDSVNSRYIPRDESDTDKDVQGNSLQYSGKVPYTVHAKDSNCGKFDGVGSYVNVGDQSALKQNAVSITCWVKIKNGSSTGDIVAQNTVNSDYGYRLYYDANINRIRFGINDEAGNSAKYVDSSNTINTGEWYFVAGTWDGTTAKFYLNSNLEESKTITQIFHGGDILFGAANTSSPFLYLEANLFDIRIFDYELSQSQINDIYSTGNIQSPKSLGRWAFSEGNDNFLYDVVPNSGKHGEIKNASLTDFWSERQDQFHYNIEHEFDLWLDGSGNKLFVPFDENGNSIKTQGDTITGWTWDSKHEPSTNFHNGAETRFDTDANDPFFGEYKRKYNDTGIHPSHDYTNSSLEYKRNKNNIEGDRFLLYLNEPDEQIVIDESKNYTKDI